MRFSIAGKRTLAPRQFNLPSTGDWQKLSTVFNSLQFEAVRVYAGIWGGKGGKFWLDDWTIEEIGPINVLRRPGTPVTVRSEDGATIFTEGRDYAPLVDPRMNPHRVDAEPLPLKILPGGRIRDGQSLRVSWCHRYPFSIRLKDSWIVALSRFQRERILHAATD